MRNIPNVNDYLEKANQGDVSSQKQLGMILVRSDDTLNEGISWLKKAANSDADAMYLLGRIYLRKFEDAKQAFYWYEKAAQNNHINAMVDVGAFYVFGYYVERDVAKAVEWYERAASLNSPLAIHNLGFLLYQKQEYTQALNFFTKAAALEYADSAYMLGVIYLQGLGVEIDAQKALDNLILADKLGKHYACRPIGDFYFQGAFDNGKQNHDEAIEWYLRGMEHDVLSCIEALAACYWHGLGVDVDLELAYDFYETAANKGSCEAAYVLGLMCGRGEGVKKDIKEALKWMIIAEKKGHPKAPKFVEMMIDTLGGNGATATVAENGGLVGIKLRRSYSAGAEAVIEEQRVRFEESKKKNASIYAAAGAMSGSGSYTDYEMGAVISNDGEVSYVNTDLGIILGADGSVSSHDANTGWTYNWSTGGTMAYNEMFKATIDFDSGTVSYNHNGYTL